MSRLKTTMFLSRIFYLVIVIANVVISVKYEFNIVFNLLVVLGWATGFLSSQGYGCRFVSKIEGKSIYEIKVPIVLIGVLRILQLLLSYFFKWKIQFPLYLILVALDIVYIIFLVLDNSHYYFELGDDEDEWDEKYF